MHASTPVVGFAAGALPEIVEDGVTGFLAPSQDVAGLTERLSRVIDDPQLAVTLGNAGCERYEAYFSARRMAEQTSKLYDQIVQDRRP
jgi:glycosyltransferase involved in cell wall biosynthesis